MSQLYCYQHAKFDTAHSCFVCFLLYAASYTLEIIHISNAELARCFTAGAAGGGGVSSRSTAATFHTDLGWMNLCLSGA